MRIPVVIALLATALAGCTSDADLAGDSAEAMPEKEEFQPVSETFNGEFAAGGVDQPHEYTFFVPAGATEVAALLTWTIPGADLDFELFDSQGVANGAGWGESSDHKYVSTPYKVRDGNWTIVVEVNRGADVHYDLSVVARIAEPLGPIMETYTILPNDFAEINLNMVPGDHFVYDWSSDGDVYFNIHFHDDGSTNRSTELTGTSHEGEFEAPATEVYSLLWANDGATPVAVTLSVDGKYRLHSMTREAPSEP